MDQLSNANLAAIKPVNTRPNTEIGTGLNAQPRSEVYPGDDVVVGDKPTFKGVAQSTNGYELNFNDAELAELTKVILRDTLHIAYVYDPRVQGRVTVSTGGPVPRTEILSILETVLAMNHGALVADGETYRIVPDTETRQGEVSVFDYADEAKQIGPGYGVAIVPLRYVSTETMMRMLESVSAKQEGVKASVHNNLMVIRGTARERQSMLELVSMFDVDWMRGQSAAVYTLQNSSADDVIKELQQVFQADGAGKGLVRFQSIHRLNAVLALTQKVDLLESVGEWVSRLDRGGAENDNYYVYRVENGRAKDLAEILRAAFGASGGGAVRSAQEIEVAPTKVAVRMESMSSPADAAAAPPEGDQHTGGAASPLASAGSPSGEPSAGSSTGGESGVNITPDERNNKLLIRSSARDYHKMLSILRRIDQPPLQVMINATLAEVTLNDNLKYGVQFFLQKNNGHAGLLGFSNTNQVEIAPAVPGLNFVLGSLVNNPRVVLDALAAETAVRVVSSPSVVVLHNQQATLQVGDEVPITTRQAQSVINPDSPLINEIEFKNTGVILKVTPRINSNGLVTMEIEQEISQIAARATEDATLTPTISQRRISSTIAVQSGQMVVLGGLISEQMNREKNSIPGLGKIPYLGDILGGSTSQTKTRTELVVFLRPVVIHDPEDASAVAQEVRAGMNSLAPRPAAWDAQISEGAVPGPMPGPETGAVK